MLDIAACALLWLRRWENSPSLWHSVPSTAWGIGTASGRKLDISGTLPAQSPNIPTSLRSVGQKLQTDKPDGNNDLGVPSIWFTDACASCDLHLHEASHQTTATCDCKLLAVLHLGTPQVRVFINRSSRLHHRLRHPPAYRPCAWD